MSPTMIQVLYELRHRLEAAKEEEQQSEVAAASGRKLWAASFKFAYDQGYTDALDEFYAAITAR